MKPSVHSTRISERGLRGVLCTPAGIAPAPGILLLSGSEGGAEAWQATVEFFAEHLPV